MSPLAYFDHIEICNRHDLSHFLPFSVAGIEVGWIRPQLAEQAVAASGYFLWGNGLALDPRLNEFGSRSAALAEASEALSEQEIVPRLRGEFYSVAPSFMAAPLAQIDRAVVQSFGLRAYGVHVNGFVRRPNGAIDMWIGRRAPTQILCPNMLDNMIAGGQPIGLTPFDNVVKEAREEADVPEALARKAKPVASVRYTMEVEDGLRQDTMFCYDLELPADFTPKNTDGEVAEFMLLPAEEVKAIVRDTFDFKFNCNLVIMDFLIRHKLLTDGEADIALLRNGMGQGIVG
jgi:hypothetical protein